MALANSRSASVSRVATPEIRNDLEFVFPLDEFAAALIFPCQAAGGSLIDLTLAKSTSTGAAAPADSTLILPSAPADTLPSSHSPVTSFSLIGSSVFTDSIRAQST